MKTANPEITVIIPVHNTGKYLARCLESVVNQTFKDIEIICVDDGSTDNSRSILEKYADTDKRIRIIERDKASGSGAVPRNIGIDTSNGTYLAILDSDDWFDEGMLEKMLNKARKYDSDLVMCDNYRVLPNGTFSTEMTELHPEFLPYKEVFSWVDIPDHIFQISHATAWHKLIRRDLIVNNGLRYQEGVPILDDIYFVNSLLVYAKRITTLSDRFVYYRVSAEGSQTSTISRHRNSIFLAFDKLNKGISEMGIYDKVKVSLQNWTLQTMHWWLYSCDDCSVFAELSDTYLKEYFPGLHLMGIDPNDIYKEEYRDFYLSIINRHPDRTIRYALENVVSGHSRIVIYGAGEYGKKLHDGLIEEGNRNIVLWADRNANDIENEKVCNPARIPEIQFDIVFIAISNLKVADEVVDQLEKIGVDRTVCYIL